MRYALLIWHLKKNSFLGLLALSIYEVAFKKRKISVMNNAWNTFSKVENVLLSCFE